MGDNFINRSGVNSMISIKTAKLEDVEMISLIFAACWKKAYKRILPRKYLKKLQDNFMNESLVKLIEDENSGLKVICNDDKIIGAAAFGKSTDKYHRTYGEIYYIYIHPKYKRKGFGSFLFNAIVNDVRNCGYKMCHLWVFRDNKKAIKFYEKMNFECSDSIRYFEVDEAKDVFPEIRYEKSLEISKEKDDDTN